MKVKDAMQTDIVTLALDESLDIADDIMTLGRVRHLPVTAGEGRLVGLVTHRDLLKASVASVLQLSRTVEHDWLKAVPIRLIMTRDVVTIAPDRPLVEAVRIMAARKIGCLPVVERDRLVGLVTETDCLRVLADLLANGAPAESALE